MKVNLPSGTALLNGYAEAAGPFAHFSVDFYYKIHYNS